MKKFEFRKRLKNRGCYVEFEFDLEFSDGPSCDIHFNYLAESEWELACRMGLHLFKAYLFRKRSGNLNLTLYKVKWIPADTNNIIVLFAMIKALSECFDLELPNLELDTASETFNFPEPRSLASVSIL